MVKILIIGASGRIGSEVVKSLQSNSEENEIILGTSNKETCEKWLKEGKKGIVLNLNKPETFVDCLNGIERLFLLTGYTSEMLFQAKTLIDAAKKVNVKYIVHLGVYTSREDFIPHFTWHDLIENYLASSGIAFTNIHPNVVTESVLVTKPPITETNSFVSLCGDAQQGWVCTKDIADVVATTLREGPDKHGGKDYYLSIEVLTSSEVAKILSEVSKKEIKCIFMDKEKQKETFDKIPSPGIRNYMESAMITMDLTEKGKFKAQTKIQDDVMTVVGRPGIKMREWAFNYFNNNP